MRVKITKREVDSLLPGGIIADEEVRGFVARKLLSGAVTYGFRYRDKKSGRQRWIGLGLHGSITPDQARNLAKKRAGEVADARDPIAEREATRAEVVKAKLAEVNTVNAVLDNFLKKYVRGSDALRSGDQIDRALMFAICRHNLRCTPGVYSLQRSALDAIPDLSDTQVIVYTEYQGLERVLAETLQRDAAGDFALAVEFGNASSRQRLAIRDYIQIITANHPFRVGAGRARNRFHHRFDLPGEAVELVEIGAQDLDADRCADAGRQHVGTGLDRHGPGIGDAGKLQRLVEVGNQAIDGQACTPLLLGQSAERAGLVCRIKGEWQIAAASVLTVGPFAVGTNILSIFENGRRFAPMRGRAPSYATPYWLRSKVTPLGLVALLSSAAAVPAIAQTAPNDPGTVGPVVVTEPKRKPVARVQTDAGRTHVRARVAGRPARTPAAKPLPGPASSVTEGARTPLKSNVVTASASRLGLPVREMPASVDIVDQQTMREQGYRTTTKTAQGAVGVLSGDAAGAPAGFSMRGFTGSSINTLYNGIWIGPQDITSRVMDTSNLNRVEFLKGPSSLMSGLDAIGVRSIT
jgi:hypothetical protein